MIITWKSTEGETGHHALHRYISSQESIVFSKFQYSFKVFILNDKKEITKILIVQFSTQTKACKVLALHVHCFHAINIRNKENISFLVLCFIPVISTLQRNTSYSLKQHFILRVTAQQYMAHSWTLTADL